MTVGFIKKLGQVMKQGCWLDAYLIVGLMGPLTTWLPTRSQFPAPLSSLVPMSYPKYLAFVHGAY